MSELTPDEARELVADLQERRCSGDDDLTLITYLCNRYRISKNDARKIYDSFYHGFQHGADRVLNTGTESAAPSSDDVVFHAASSMSVDFTQNVVDEKRRAASGCGFSTACIFAVLFLVLRSIVA